MAGLGTVVGLWGKSPALAVRFYMRLLIIDARVKPAHNAEYVTQTVCSLRFAGVAVPQVAAIANAQN